MEFRQRHFLNRRPGLSLIEVLVVMGIIGLVMAISMSGYASSRRRAALTTQARLAATAVHEAQARALTARAGQSWSIRCAGDRLELFTSVGATNPSFMKFEANVSCQGATEVQFQKLTGEPQSAATFVLLHQGQAYSQIHVAAPGVITLSSL